MTKGSGQGLRGGGAGWHFRRDRRRLRPLLLVPLVLEVELEPEPEALLSRYVSSLFWTLESSSPRPSRMISSLLLVIVAFMMVSDILLGTGSGTLYSVSLM